MCTALFLSVLAYSVVTNVFLSTSFLFFVFSGYVDDESKHSALCGAERRIGVIGVVVNMNEMSIMVNVWRARTKRFGSCAAPRWFLGPRMCSSSPKYISFGRKYLDMHLADFYFSQLVCFLVCEDVGLAWMDFKFHALPYFFCLKSAIIFLSCFQGGRHCQHVVSEAEGLIHSLFFVAQFDGQALFFPSSNVFLHC